MKSLRAHHRPLHAVIFHTVASLSFHLHVPRMLSRSTRRQAVSLLQATVLLFDTTVLLFHSESNGLTLLDSESFNFSLI
jgi:hypothetical protein